MTFEPPTGPAEPSSPEQRLSYKFQRLRERLRAAIASGELAGKLPGERELAKQFKVNTKTLSKALGDLAADGLVERNIGLGTFVRCESSREVVRVLLIHGPERGRGLAASADPQLLQITSQPDTAEIGGSLLAKFDCVVIASDRVPGDVIRDLVVRGRRVILLGQRPAAFATWAVMIDEPAAAAALAQRLARRGHKRLMIVGYDGDGEIMAAVRAAVPDSAVEIHRGVLTELADAMSAGITGMIVLPSISPKTVIDHCTQFGHAVPEKVSVLAVGWSGGAACSGIFVTPEQTAAALAQLADPRTSSRPVTVWVSGSFIDAGTLSGPCAGQ